MISTAAMIVIAMLVLQYFKMMNMFINDIYLVNYFTAG